MKWRVHQSIVHHWMTVVNTYLQNIALSKRHTGLFARDERVVERIVVEEGSDVDLGRHHLVVTRRNDFEGDGTVGTLNHALKLQGRRYRDTCTDKLLPLILMCLCFHWLVSNNSQKLSKIMTCYRPFETRPKLRWGIDSDYQKCSQVNFSIPMA